MDRDTRRAALLLTVGRIVIDGLLKELTRESTGRPVENHGVVKRHYVLYLWNVPLPSRRNPFVPPDFSPRMGRLH